MVRSSQGVFGVTAVSGEFWMVAASVFLAVLLAALAYWGARRRRDAGQSQVGVPSRLATRATTFYEGLAKTRSGLRTFLGWASAARGGDESACERLEEALLAADVGVKVASRLLAFAKGLGTASPGELRAALVAEVSRLLSDGPTSEPRFKPWVILVVGVNGAGKTTTVGKLAARYVSGGKKVLLVGADTFRAAATEQLGVWAKRVGSHLVKLQPGGDPGAAVFDGLRAAKARDVDVVLVDTAGRLHTKKNLMEELRKIARVAGREVEGAPHEVLLVLDATSGQNSLAQAREFLAAVSVTGVVVTKLDGTAKGGMVLAVKEELGIPVRYVGLGEGIEDLKPFDPLAFAEALFAESAAK